MDSYSLELQQFLPMWRYIRGQPFKRAPYGGMTYEMAIGDASYLLTEENSAKSRALLRRLHNMIKLEDQRHEGGYRWTPVAGLWMLPNEKATEHQEIRSMLPRAVFSEFWDRELSPFLFRLREK